MHSSKEASVHPGQVTRSFKMPWKKHSQPYSADKLLIPLPVPHPAHIAVTIYNRDADEPIPLESDICQSILRGIEESHGCSHEIGRYLFA